MSYLLPSIVIGVLALDTTIAFQILLSQPIFACPILGWILGNPQLGFEIGLIMQLLWLHLLPVGSAIFPEGNIASMVICTIAVSFGDLPYPNLVFAFAILTGILVSFAGAWLTVLDRKINGIFLKFAQKSAQRVKVGRIKLIEIQSIFIYFVLMTLLAFISLLISDFALSFIKNLFSESLEQKFVMIKPVILGIGVMFTLVLIIDQLKKKLPD